LIVAISAKDYVVATAAEEHIVARPPEKTVVPTATAKGVVAWASVEFIVTCATGEGVVSFAALEARGRHGPVAVIHEKYVVAPQAEDPNASGVGDGRYAACHWHGPPVDQNCPRSVATGRERVVLIIAGDRQNAPGEDCGDGRDVRVDTQMGLSPLTGDIEYEHLHACSGVNERLIVKVRRNKAGAIPDQALLG
jgi:hypothetical protein